MKTLIKLSSCAFLLIIMTFVTSCKKDDDNEPAKITDADGNVYTAISIGTQVWLKENLRTTRFQNGELIGTTNPATLDISNETEPKYQWAYEGNASLANTYGRLYTWHAVKDTNNICPKGWHVPSDAEWTILENYLINNGYNFDNTVSGNKIAKSLATSDGWNSSTNNGAVGNSDYPEKRNLSNFTALPAGRRGIDSIAVFGYMNTDTRWWTSSEYSASVAWTRHISYGDSCMFRNYRDMKYGLAVRCVKD